MATPQVAAVEKKGVQASALIIIQIMALVWGGILVGLQFMFSPGNMMAIGLTGAGVGLAAVALFMPLPKAMSPEELVKQEGKLSIKDILFIVAVALIVGGAGLGPASSDFISASADLMAYFQMMGMLLVYGLFFLLFIEYSYTSFRFAKIKQYAEVYNLESLELNPVMYSYIGVSFVLAGIAAVITVVVFVAAKGMSVLLPPALKASVEFNSLYGVTIMAGVIFGLIAIAYTFIFGWESFQKITRSFKTEEEEEEEEEEE